MVPDIAQALQSTRNLLHPPAEAITTTASSVLELPCEAIPASILESATKTCTLAYVDRIHPSSGKAGRSYGIGALATTLACALPTLGGGGSAAAAREVFAWRCVPYCGCCDSLSHSRGFIFFPRSSHRATKADLLGTCSGGFA